MKDAVDRTKPGTALARLRGGSERLRAAADAIEREVRLWREQSAAEAAEGDSGEANDTQESTTTPSKKKKKKLYKTEEWASRMGLLAESKRKEAGIVFCTSVLSVFILPDLM